MARQKHYVSGSDLIRKVKTPKAKTAAFRPFLEPWKKPRVRVKIQRRRNTGGGVPMPRQGTLGRHL